MNPRILVTGGTGLLGAYLLRWFKHHGYSQLTATYQQEESRIPKDLREDIHWEKLIMPDLETTYSIIEGHDWVVHSAGLISYSPAAKNKLLEVNQEGTRLLVNACLTFGVQHLIYISSIGSLGREKNFDTLNENSPWLENEWSTSYGLSKYLGELEAWRGAAEGLAVSTILPSVILGTGDWQSGSLQIFDRIANKPGLHPSGQTGYVDVRDIAEFIGLLLERNNAGERWILNAENLPYSQFYKMAGAAMGLNKQFSSAPKWLAKMILTLQGMISGGEIGSEVLNHVYGTFTYDASKSMAVEGFSYRTIQDSIAETSNAFKQGKAAEPLSF